MHACGTASMPNVIKAPAFKLNILDNFGTQKHRMVGISPWSPQNYKFTIKPYRRVHALGIPVGFENGCRFRPLKNQWDLIPIVRL